MRLERYTVSELPCLPDRGLTGRRKIKTTKSEINAENVRDVVERALAVHALNAAEITYLWEYYKGCQDIRIKEKLVRENINAKICVNRANEIVTFKTAYLLNAPVQYISYGGDAHISAEIDRLNNYMRLEDKESKDKEIVDWMHICGVAERLVLPDARGEEDGAPFNVETIDPRDAFVIYSAKIGQKPMAGVLLQYDEDENLFAAVYTEKNYFEVTKTGVTSEAHTLGAIPLVEYLNNDARMGAFEPVLSVLNNINTLESNAVDSIQDFVNAFDVFQNCDIADGEYKNLSVGGNALKIKTSQQGYEAKVYRVYSELDQTGVQTRIDDMTDAYLTICGMPNRNGGSSTSDTGAATIFRDGWAEADSRAIETEKTFKRSERAFLRVVLNICAARAGYDLDIGPSDIQPEFLRKNLANAQSKVQILCEMLNNPKIHPKLAFEAAGGLFKDTENAYRISEDYYSAYLKEEEERTLEDLSNARTEALRAGRYGGDSSGEDGNTEE